MRPRPKTVQQIFNKKWPNKQPQNSAPEYTSPIEQELALYIPEKLQDIIKIKQFDKGMLTLTIPNASFQMQFNAIRSELMSKLRINNPSLISIKCIVEPSRQVSNSAKTHHTSTHQAQPSIKLSDNAKANLAAILPDMPEEIKTALAKLMNK
ncbi:hypothetical protein N7931_01055 [Catenovulum sp. 2E275]|uniref:hypothetical protein n=1 Tax=Catenovulum sp. 2E275 TaxID=2980497 RepID=UPI0021CEC092|nr:hypothetical protein [Catenovulum sp. 2E275]MCU4674206.1 hypothetical protein [Catenovulum sp. 2E275]